MTLEQPDQVIPPEIVATLRQFQNCNEHLLRELRRQTQLGLNAQCQLDDAQLRLDDTRLQLDEARLQLHDARLQLDDARLQLGQTQVQLDDTRLRFDDTRLQLDDARLQLDHIRHSRSFQLLQRALGPAGGWRRKYMRRVWRAGPGPEALRLAPRAEQAAPGQSRPAAPPITAPPITAPPVTAYPVAARPVPALSLRREEPNPDFQAAYDQWIALHEPDEAALERQRRTRLPREPLISLVVPVHRTPPAFLFGMLESVKAQTYAHWELCLVDGGSADAVLRSIVESYHCQDNRVCVRFLATNRSRAGNTNAALELAAGEYVGFLNANDTLAPFALFEVARALSFHNDADLLYSDEDRIDAGGCRRFDPFFKPAWSPDMLRSCNYVRHFAVYRRELLQALGGLRDELDGAEDHDLVLRVGERTRRIVHIPCVLYHERDHIAATARPAAAAATAVRRALTEHLHRRGWDGDVIADCATGTCELRLALPRRPLVSVLIPNKDAHQVLDTCLRSLRSATYENLEILVIENNSLESATFDYYGTLGSDPRIRVLTWPGPFHYAAIHNWAVPQARGEILLLLNNDVEARHTDWIERLLEHALRDEVGAVGAKLFYPDGTIQHAGTTLSLEGPAVHTHRGHPGDSLGENGRLMMIGNRSAVTGACLMLRSELFSLVGGFDERFAVNFNDVDLCLKIRQLDRLIVWTPFARLWHYESRTRGTFSPQVTQALWTREAQWFREKWAEFLAAGDPYHNPNLSLTSGDCRVDPHGARPPRPREAGWWSVAGARRAA